MSDLYLECFSGISGDMTVATLLDLGADQTELLRVLKTIPDQSFRIEISTVSKNGIACKDFNVILENDNHDHDMDYLFGHQAEYAHHGDHEHSHEEHHHHEHHHDHDAEHAHHHEEHEHHHHDEHGGHSHGHEHHHSHQHRGLPEVIDIIEKTDLTQNAKQIAKNIFDILADAESKAHNKPKNEVHFHEVGALDSIVDIIAAAFCIDNLQIEKVFAPNICEGTGTIRCQHGILPIPVPATLNILQAHNLAFSIKNINAELITPTGAAILASLKPCQKLPEQFSVTRIGQGAGKRNYEQPSILRGMLIKSALPATEKDTIVKLETNIDDCTAENLGYIIEESFKNGALDAHFVPCFMKKNRPAYLLTVICNPQDRQKIENLIFLHTSTIGIRRCEMERTKLARQNIEVQTKYGKALVKRVQVEGLVKNYPEYESIASICRESGESFDTVYTAVKLAAGSV